MIETKVEIEKYFQELGVKPYKNILQFWSALDEEYGMTRARQLESAYIKLNEGEEGAFYSIIFEEFDVGMAFASLRINLYQSFLTWLTNFIGRDSPGVIYDLGCGNGILTCLYAKLYPKTKIVGFDISTEAINCSNILKKKLTLDNVEFIVADIKSMDDKSYNQGADIVISVASIDPIADDNQDNQNKNLVSLCDSISKERILEPLTTVSNLLKDEDSVFISFDKVKTLKQQLRRINSISKSGMTLDYLNSSWLSYQDVEQEQIKLPCFVARKGDQAGNLEESVSFLATKESQLTGVDLTDGYELEAELSFTYLNPKQFVKGARADYRDGTGSVWQEIWQAGPLILKFEHTNHGYRGLSFNSICNLNDSIDEHDNWIEQSKNYADIEVLTKPDIEFVPLSGISIN